MTNSRLHTLDIRLLRYFAVVAEENNISRAAQRLFISQPPLSQLSAPAQQALRLGLTTAFEQGVFAAAEFALGEYTGALHITRQSSPALAQLVRKGKLDAALVALPLNTEGLHLHPLPYGEPLIAALPASWPEAARADLTLSALNHRPLFWFKRERNPDFFDYTRRIFDRAGYVPTYVEEPAEHDVLLARIARGAGLILLPASFSAIQRQRVVFCPLQDASQQLPLRLGMVTLPANERVRERVTAVVEKSLL